MGLLVGTVIKDSFALVSVPITDTRLTVLCLNAGLDAQATYIASDAMAIQRLELKELERLLAMPDQTEGDLSLKWDRAAVSRYCEGLRIELGLSTQGTPTIRDASNLW